LQLHVLLRIKAPVTFAAVVVILQKKAKENANLALMRNRKQVNGKKTTETANECPETK
jgi:hypothetical protein